MRTRVGYAGGARPDPTYEEIGDHTETLQVDFVPELVSYEELLALFWKSHNPFSKSWSRQYRNAIFCHSEGQLRLAQESARMLASRREEDLQTLVEVAGHFYLAEDYHQKYRLRHHAELVQPLLAVYSDLEAFVNSTAATRLNAYVAGESRREVFEREFAGLGLSPDGERCLRSLFR